MKHTDRSVSWNQWILLATLFLFPLSSVYAACCAGHGGVARCDKTTGQQVCKDGTVSPTCTCAKSKKAQKKAPKAKTKKAAEAAAPVGTTTKTTTPKTTAPKTKSSWWGNSSNSNNASTKDAATKKAQPQKTTQPQKTNKSWFGNQSGSQKAKGCCSNHGGVAQCNRTTGFQTCKDGTTSPTCRCQ